MPSEPARFLEDFGGNGALHRSIRFPADAVFRIIPPLRARGSVWHVCPRELHSDFFQYDNSCEFLSRIIRDSRINERALPARAKRNLGLARGWGLRGPWIGELRTAFKSFVSLRW